MLNSFFHAVFFFINTNSSIIKLTNYEIILISFNRTTFQIFRLRSFDKNKGFFFCLLTQDLVWFQRPSVFLHKSLQNRKALETRLGKEISDIQYVYFLDCDELWIFLCGLTIACFFILSVVSPPFCEMLSILFISISIKVLINVQATQVLTSPLIVPGDKWGRQATCTYINAM